MKNLKKLTVWLLIAVMILGMTHSVFAEPQIVILDVKSDEYKEEAGDNWVVPSTTKDYLDVLGGIQRAASTGNPKVRFTLGNKYQGKYKVEFFRVQSSADTIKAKFFVHENGKLNAKTVELNLQNERGWTEIGVYNFSGDVNDVVIENGLTTGWLRISAIRLIPVEYLDSLSITSNNSKIGTIPFSTDFNQKTTDYTAYAGFLTDSVTVEAGAPEGATVTISSDTSAVTENTVTLKDGENKIKVAVERADNGATAEYNITVIKQAEEIIDFNMPGRITIEGNWAQSSAQSAPYGVYGKYYDSTAANENGVTYKPVFEKAGNYEVNVYRVIYGSDSADKHVQWEIYHNGKTDIVYVDNLTPGVSGWENLGVFDFSGEEGEYIKASRVDTTQKTTRVSAINYKEAAADELVISKPSFYEKDGEGNKAPVYKLSGETSDIECSYTISNTSQTPQSYVLIMAVYNGDTFEKAVVSPAEKLENNQIIKQSVSIADADTAGKTVKAFLWGGIDTMKPLCNVAEIKN